MNNTKYNSDLDSCVYKKKIIKIPAGLLGRARDARKRPSMRRNGKFLDL